MVGCVILRRSDGHAQPPRCVSTCPRNRRLLARGKPEAVGVARVMSTLQTAVAKEAAPGTQGGGEECTASV